ncbi:MFS transporter [Pseudonocardia sp. C8]|uniref:MFS transporter n=1 Tax=Pseudonocardia sp. C8 TaxID=2762759 RepID=UPI001C92F18E
MKTTPYQLATILFCVAVNALDGYDVFIMGYALPYLPAELASPVDKGYLLSSALVGLGVGAMFLARFADIYGRRPVFIAGLLLNTAGLLGSALAPNFGVLLTSRFFTGLAVGVIGTVCIVTCQEMAPASKRSMAVGMVMFGYPVGSFVAGTFGTAVLGLFGGAWQGFFWLGTLLSGLLLVVCIVFMPESVMFLQKKPDAASQEKYRALAGRMHLEEEPARAPSEATGSEKVRLLGRRYRAQTLYLWTGYTFLTAAFYFIGSWTPQLISNASGDKGAGALAGVMVSVGTMAGALLFGYLGLRRPAAFLSWVSVAIAMVALVGFALVLQGFFALGMAVVMSAGLFVALSAYAGASGTVYPAAGRASGYGTMLGMGRVGAIVAPIIGGYVVTLVSPNAMFLGVLIPMGLAVVCSMLLQRSMRVANDTRDVEAANA